MKNELPRWLLALIWLSAISVALCAAQPAAFPYREQPNVSTNLVSGVDAVSGTVGQPDASPKMIGGQYT